MRLRSAPAWLNVSISHAPRGKTIRARRFLSSPMELRSFTLETLPRRVAPVAAT